MNVNMLVVWMKMLEVQILMGNKSRDFGPMHIYELLKHNICNGNQEYHASGLLGKLC